MPKYGFRLYEVRLKKNNERKIDRPFVVHDDAKLKWSYATHFRDICDANTGVQVRGFPRSDDATAPSVDELAKMSAMRMEDVVSYPGGVLVRFLVGRHDGFDKAIPPAHLATEEDKELEGYTVVRPYRAILCLTSDPTLAILAVEAIGTQCPVQFLSRWSTKWSQKRSVTQLPGEDQPSRVYWRLRPEQLGNEEQRKQFLKKGKPVRVVLQSHEFNKARKAIRKKFEITVETKGRKDSWVKRWVSEAFTVSTDKEFAESLAEDENEGFTALDIDDGYLVVETSGGRKKVSPSRLPEAFTYGVDPDEWPEDDDFKTAVKVEVLNQLRAKRLTLDETEY